MEQSELRDFYEILQVSRRADPLVITRTYRLLASLYHPDNKQTGNEDKFVEIVDAYRTLSDPVRRASYDRAYFGDGGMPGLASDGTSSFSSDHSFDSEHPIRDERQMRRHVLQALYDVRRNRPYHPGLSLLVISEILACSIDDAQFTLWYLRGKKLIEIADDDAIAITVAGVDYLEATEAEPVSEVRPASLPRHLAQISMPDGDGARPSED
jgi:curved DNA-binding protein CbpA